MKSPLKQKSYNFALRIINLYKYLVGKKEFVLSKQILRSGTAIGALITEAKFRQSKADFSSKMSIALKEANETVYWLCLLNDSGYINKRMFSSLDKGLQELMAMLVATVKTSRKK